MLLNGAEIKKLMRKMGREYAERNIVFVLERWDHR